jgi:hypothetical protein
MYYKCARGGFLDFYGYFLQIMWQFWPPGFSWQKVRWQNLPRHFPDGKMGGKIGHGFFSCGKRCGSFGHGFFRTEKDCISLVCLSNSEFSPNQSRYETQGFVFEEPRDVKSLKLTAMPYTPIPLYPYTLYLYPLFHLLPDFPASWFFRRSPSFRVLDTALNGPVTTS